MNRETVTPNLRWLLPLVLLFAAPMPAWTQGAVAEIEEIEELPVISSSEIEELIGPIALYPDDLLAIVLPAATYPLQVVEAARFIEALESDASLEPDPDWDDSIVALLNYPEVLAMLNEDLDWTWRLGEAVVAQQSDVIAAIELFRDRAYAAGNLESDDYQLVSHEGGAIQITPVEEDVIYVPYYEPEEVVVYQPRPVYYYYPRPYPVYYYPYPSHHVFYDRHFWGVTTAFTIGWHVHHLNVYHHSFFGHPYYGRTYWDRWWYRRPSINVYNNYYVRNYGSNYNRYRQGDRWYPGVRRTIRQSDQRVTRTRYYPGNGDSRSDRRRSDNTSFAPSRNNGRTVVNRNPHSTTPRNRTRDSERPEIRFRARPDTAAVDRTASTRPSTSRPSTRPSTNRPSTRPGNDRATSRSGSSRPSTQPSITTRRDFADNGRRTTSRTSTSRAEPSSSRPSTSRASQSSRPTVNRATSYRSSQQSRAPSNRSSQQSRAPSNRSSQQSRAQSSRQTQPRSQSRAKPSKESRSSSQSSRRSESRSGSRSESRSKRR